MLPKHTENDPNFEPLKLVTPLCSCATTERGSLWPVTSPCHRLRWRIQSCPNEISTQSPNQIGWCNHFDLKKKKQVQDFKFKEGCGPPHRFAFDISSHVQSWMFGVNLSCRPCGHCHKALISLITEERTGPEGRKSSKKYADAKGYSKCFLHPVSRVHCAQERTTPQHKNTMNLPLCQFFKPSSRWRV